jgi:hypothetical protein
MREVIGKSTLREISDRTGVHAEAIRRYMGGRAPSPEFLAALCAMAGVSAHWMLTGEGPMHTEQVRAADLERATPAQIMSAMVAAIERLSDRVETLEGSLDKVERQVRRLQSHQDPAERD